MPGTQILWVPDFFILEHSITFCSYLLWVPIMPGTQILWVPDFFILEHPITFCSYLSWVQEDGRRANIVYPVENNMDAAGIEPVTSR
jgi:hypothetical protein